MLKKSEPEETMGLPLKKEEKVFTYADYKEWELGEFERFELIYGEAYAMSAPNAKHQEILTELVSQFHEYLRGKTCRVYPAPYDVRLFYEEDESDDTVVQPDLSVICDEQKRGYEGCRGAPDLVVEILSLSNTAIEMERKLKLYLEAGVKEYWVVDPENKGLTVYHFQKGAIITKTYKSDGTVPVGIFPGLDIKLEQVFAE
jgi:Uma2 family endonuclease